MPGIRRRGVLGGGLALGAAPSLAVRAKAGSVIWHVGPGDGRTDPFVSWVREVMLSRHGIRVLPQPGPDGADVLTVWASGPDATLGQPWRIAGAHGLRSFAVPQTAAPEGRLLIRLLLEARACRPELGFLRLA